MPWISYFSNWPDGTPFSLSNISLLNTSKVFSSPAVPHHRFLPLFVKQRYKLLCNPGHNKLFPLDGIWSFHFSKRDSAERTKSHAGCVHFLLYWALRIMSNSLPPASVIASWPAPDYIHPVRRGPGLLIVNVLFSSLAFILTVLRVYTRAFITATIGLDDVLAVLALVRS